MPKQTRWLLKQDLDGAIGNLEAASTKVVRVASRFKGVHDNYYKALEAIWTSIELTRKSIKQIRDEI